MNKRSWTAGCAALMIVGLHASGCADVATADDENDELNNSERTRLCLTSEGGSHKGGEALAVGDDGRVILWVESGGCISVGSASCTATQTGDVVDVQSEIEWIDSGESRCTLELTLQAVLCDGFVDLEEGTISLVHGNEWLDVDVPGLAPVCP